MILNQAVNQFLIHQRASGRSPHTIGAHQRDLRLLLGHLGGDCDLAAVTAHDLDAFLLTAPVILQTSGAPKSVTSINRIRSTIKAFFGWLLASGVTSRNSSAAIRIRRGAGKPPTYLTDDEVRNLLKTIRTHKGWQAQRDLTMVLVMLNTGRPMKLVDYVQRLQNAKSLNPDCWQAYEHNSSCGY